MTPRFPLLLAVVAAGGIAAAPPPSLGILRYSPTETAQPTDIIMVTFNRPVAGQLDGTVNPRTIFSIVPAVPGRAEWRDPITLRFTPTAPLTPNVTYTVTIANTFRAMDGSRLDEPFRFSFKVGGPKPLSESSTGGHGSMYLKSDAEFDVIFSSPVDLAMASRVVYLDVGSPCLVSGRVSVTASSQRAISERDPGDVREAGGWERNRQADRLRRIVRFKPSQPLPWSCHGDLVVPDGLSDDTGVRLIRYPWSTYGPLRFVKVTCTNEPMCPAGWAMLEFSTPVSGAAVKRAVHLSPAAPFTVDDTTDERTYWSLEAPLRTRTDYTITIDESLRDVFDQPLTGVRARSMTTTGYAPGLEYATGRMLVERESFRTIAVRHVNTDTLFVTTAPVPESLEARILGAPEYNLGDAWSLVQSFATTRAVPVNSALDTPLVSAIKLPAYNAARPGGPTLTVLKISRTREDTATTRRYRGNMALVLVTDIGITARVGAAEAAVWVTGVKDGLPKTGANVTLYGRNGQVRARATTDAQGLVRFTGLEPDTATARERYNRFEGYIAAQWESDRAVVSVGDNWELSPWRFNVQGAGESDRALAAGAVFTERGIYRPGEVVHAKAIVRTGTLGALRVPNAGDSLRWYFRGREAETLKDTIVAGSAFGTADQALTIPNDAALGTWSVAVRLKRGNDWIDVATAGFRVAEYRPPEFLVTVDGDTSGRMAGDSLRVTAEARYLFGAPMGRAPVRWTLRRAPMWPWELRIPGAEDYEIGESGYWWEEDEDTPADTEREEVLKTRVDTLDATGHATFRTRLTATKKGRPARITLEANVTDVNRQSSASRTSVVMHPAEFYIGAKTAVDEWFWRAGTPVAINVIAVRPSGEKVSGVAIHGTIERREWHRVQRRRDGLDERVGEWVADTVAQCDVASAATPQPCRFTPAQGGTYVVRFRAKDSAGRDAMTSFYRWATGRGWVPWEDESQFKMDVIPDKTRYDVGDTATVLFASPFTGAEAWITVEREGILDQRRMRLEAGATSFKLPLTEAHVPNVFVSIVVARGRSAPAGGIADAGRPTIRVGYAELKVQPRVKRLTIDVHPLADEYRPGDTARVNVRVRDVRGAGRRSEVTLWAVDEGVLALTGYKTPDPIELLYRPRGVGMHLASDLVSVAPQVLENEGTSLKGDRAPGGGGGLEGGDVLRSRFSSTAFFLGSVVTDDNGNAIAKAKLPDNLTTFRVMAVAVTAGDRYGSGQSSMLVTRPLLARPALPRFLRRDDRFLAGVVVNQRAGGTPTVQVTANARGASIGEANLKTATLATGRGSEVRFLFRDTTSDSTAFRFDVTNGRDSDAVLTRLAVRPSGVPRSHVASGVVMLTSSVELNLPGDIDPEHSKLTFSIGTAPLAIIGGMYRDLFVYPYDCSEQITDEMLPLVALLKAGAAPAGVRIPPDARSQLADGVATLTRRQKPDGSIGLWNANDWSTPWLSAHAGQALLGARAAGIAVRDSVLARLADYLQKSVHRPDSESRTPMAWWLTQLQVRLAEKVAALDFLSKFGTPDISGEEEVLRMAPQMAWEDRMRLAEILGRRGQIEPARRLLAPIWALTRVEGRRAVLPDSAYRAFYFWSDRRPIARLLSATLVVDYGNPLVAPLVETLVEQGRTQRFYWWNTQDFGAAVEALADFTERQRGAARRGFTVAANGQALLRSAGGGDVMRDFTRDLSGLLTPNPDGTMKLVIAIAAPSGDNVAPLYYHVTVEETPKVRPVTPDQNGIAVERWYEDFTTGRPIISATEGSLVRVRLRVRVTSERRFLVLEDPLPAGLEAVDLSLRTAGGLPGPGANPQPDTEESEETDSYFGWYYGAWDGGWWSPFDHRELRDDRVVYFATYLWPGTFTASYVARATTPGVFVRPPAHAEEMYNPAVRGRSDGGVFTVNRKP